MSVIGKLVYKFYYGPKNRRAIIKKYGGRASYQSMLRAEQEMKVYALNKLQINSSFNANGKFRISFLTGEKYIHQTLFCISSFFKFLTPDESADFAVDIYDDGSLSKDTLTILGRRFPEFAIVSLSHSLLMVGKKLPIDDFPYLNGSLQTHPLFKKLIFPNLKTGLTIFFDSDMLFFKRPEAFINWLYTQSQIKGAAFCLPDIKRSYGYTNDEILKVWPVPIKNNINTGMYALDNELMDFKFIERLGNDLESAYGSQYYIEQLMTAIILEKSPALTVAPKADYIVMPTQGEVEQQTDVLHHYVDTSKKYYFETAWKNFKNG